MKYQSSENWQLQDDGPKKYRPLVTIYGSGKYGYELEFENAQTMSLEAIHDLAVRILKWTDDMEKEITLS